jgi:hypothetical protein
MWLLRTLLFEVQAHDPGVFLGLAAVGVFAFRQCRFRSSAVTQKRPMAVTKNPANGAGLPFAQL